MRKMDKKETIQNKTAPGHKYNVKFSYFKDPIIIKEKDIIKSPLIHKPK